MSSVPVPDMEWKQFQLSEKLDDKDVKRIIMFYLFQTPCPDLSAMGKPLIDYSWKEPLTEPHKYLIRQFRETLTSKKLLIAESYKELDEKLNDAELSNNFTNDLSDERVCFYKNKSSQFYSLLSHIRNALAHGRFKIAKTKYGDTFVLEDVSGNGEISARMILRKETLLNWIDIIERGAKAYEKKRANRKKSRTSKKSS